MSARRLVAGLVVSLCAFAGVSMALGASAFASAPTLAEESVHNVGTMEATLSARIEPGGESTSYHLEYGPSLPYASSTTQETVNSTEAVNVRVRIQDLEPGVSYHYRFVASNAQGAVEGGDQTFATYPPATLGLPDNRGYEKVSPTNNADGNVYEDWPLGVSTEGGFTELPFDTAPDGNAVAYIGMPSEEGGSGREGFGKGEQYVAHRAADGRWTAANVTPPSDQGSTIPVYQGFSADLSRGFLTTNAGTPLVPGAPAGHYRVPYVHDFETGAYESLLPALPPNRGAGEFGAYETADGFHSLEPVFAGSSADSSHVLYMVNDALTANAIDGGKEDNNLYEFHDGGLTLVNVLPNGSPEPNAVFGGPAINMSLYNYITPDFSHVISKDGNRIFWTGQGANRNIYLREDGARTVQVDAEVGGGGQYRTATPDGSKVLFTKGGDLYEYNVVSGQTADLTPGAEVQGIVGTSEDLSYVYFVANAVLASGAKQGTCAGGEDNGGKCGLYALHVGEPVRFVAMLSSHDDDTINSFEVRSGDWQDGLADKEAAVTPDGRQVLFSSVLPLIGNSGGLFVYEFDHARLNCISCKPAAGPSTGGGFLPISHQGTYSPQWMSDDGSRVFFDSFGALVPQDTNGDTDVYEWERDGSGGCNSSGGCQYLLTGGVAEEGSYLIGSSASGNDVFFTTRAQLVAEDQNENIDVYDAHAGAIVPPAPPQCTGTGCQGLPSAPPVFSTPSSVTYSGVGNFAAPSKVAVKTKKAKAKKKVKAKEKHQRRRQTKKSKRASKSTKGRGHGSSAHRSAVSNGRSK